MVTGLESSLWYSIITVGLALGIGGGLAVVERLWQQPAPRWFIGSMLLPVFLPPVIVATSFIATFGTQGLLPLPILYSPTTILLAYGYYNVPLAYSLFRSALNGISPATEAAAQLLGANRWQRFRQVLLPQLRLAIIGTTGIIFLYSFTSFILPLQLGGVHGQTMEVWLYKQIYLYHQPTIALVAAAIQFLILLTVMIVLVFTQPNYVPAQYTPLPATPSQWYWTVLRGLLTGLVLLPLLALVRRIITTITATDVTTLLNSQFSSALLRTLGITLIVLMISISMVMLLRLGTTLGLLLLSISPITASFIWYQLFGKGYLSIVGALLLSVLPITTIILHQARQRYGRSLLQTSRVLGAHVWDRLKLEYRLQLPAIRSVVIFGVILILGDASISTNLTPHQQPLAMGYALQLIGSYHFAVGSLAMLIILGCMTGIITVFYARR
ncbi:MAG: iron ABC transporter permease [Candidatus Kerfeldbacteria bacterium]|nr:iron ABC transporter permease [Candidatus Kerfeldbacteria bacterium]